MNPATVTSLPGLSGRVTVHEVGTPGRLEALPASA
jgi:hypothetical protein